MIAVAKTLAYYGANYGCKKFNSTSSCCGKWWTGGSKGVDCSTHNSMIKGLNLDAGTSGACTIKLFTAVIYGFS